MEEAKTQKKEHGKAYKIANIILDVLFVAFAVFAITAIIFRSTTSNNKNGRSINGTQLRTVQTGSMAENNHIDPETYKTYEIKTLPINTLISIKEVKEKNEEKFYNDLKVGDVLTFVYYTDINNVKGQYVFTHRLIEKEVSSINGGFRLVLMGDAEKPSGGVQVIYTNPLTAEQSYSYVIGKVTWSNHPIGEVVSFVKSRNGILFLVVLPCSLLFIYEIGKIIYLINKDKKAKKQLKMAETETQLNSSQAEIEALKAQLAALQNKEEQGKADIDGHNEEKIGEKEE